MFHPVNFQDENIIYKFLIHTVGLVESVFERFGLFREFLKFSITRNFDGFKAFQVALF